MTETMTMMATVTGNNGTFCHTILSDSARPYEYRVTEIAWERNSGKPMAAPIPSPRLREIRKYAPPTPTLMFVAIDEKDKVVINVIEFARMTTRIV